MSVIQIVKAHHQRASHADQPIQHHLAGDIMNMKSTKKLNDALLQNLAVIFYALVVVITFSSAIVHASNNDQQYDQAIDMNRLLELQQASSAPIAAYETSVQGYYGINTRIAHLSSLPNIENRLREAAALTQELVAIEANMSEAILDLEGSMDELISELGANMVQVTESPHDLQAQKADLEALLRQKSELENLSILDDDTYSHIANISRLSATHDAIVSSTNYAGSPASAEGMSRYITTRLRDLKVMRLVKNIVNATHRQITGLVNQRGMQSAQNVATNSIAVTPIDAETFIKSTEQALSLDEDAVKRNKPRRSGNPFEYNDN